MKPVFTSNTSTPPRIRISKGETNSVSKQPVFFRSWSMPTPTEILVRRSGTNLDNGGRTVQDPARHTRNICHRTQDCLTERNAMVSESHSFFNRGSNCQDPPLTLTFQSFMTFTDLKRTPNWKCTFNVCPSNFLQTLDETPVDTDSLETKPSVNLNNSQRVS